LARRSAAGSRLQRHLLKRVFDLDLEHCPNCGGAELKIIAAILEGPAIEKTFTHVGLQAADIAAGG
jgi:hypothetical protein